MNPGSPTPPPMIVHLNGQYVPGDQARVSVFDRGFLYGDGLFETLRAYEGRFPLWPRHWARLASGARLLGLRLPADEPALRAIAGELLQRNQLGDAVVRIAVSRGPGPRGYSPRGAAPPTLVVSAHPAPALEATPPPARRLRTSSHRLPMGDPLGQAKTSSKLLHVLARAEAEAAGADEALLLNSAGRVAEADSANLFWFEDGTLHTPPLAEGPLAGVTRGFVLDLAREAGWSVGETAADLERLGNAGAVCLTNATAGIVEVAALDDRSVRPGPGPALLREAYRAALRRLLCD